MNNLISGKIFLEEFKYWLKICYLENEVYRLKGIAAKIKEASEQEQSEME